MTTPTFDPAALQARISAVQVASDALDEARANCTAAKNALDAAELVFNQAKEDAVNELSSQAGVGPFAP